MDGIEVMAVIFAKRIGITVGTFVMMYNIGLYIICGIVVLKAGFSPYILLLHIQQPLKQLILLLKELTEQNVQ